MAVIGELLFYRGDHASVSDVIRHVEQQIGAKVDQYDQRRFDDRSDDEVVREIARDLAIGTLSVDFEAGEKSVEEITVTVRDVFNDQARIPGYRVSKSFPFTGDPALWTFGTGQWGSTMPRGAVSRKRITVGMEVRTSDTEAAIAHIASTVEEIKRYLALQRAPLEAFNASLPARVLPFVQTRRSRRGEAQSLLDRF